MNHPLLITAILSYLLGSIPFGYILVRLVRGEDVRQSGSGNIGATNVGRTSPALGILTLVLDALKGMLAVWLTHKLFSGEFLVLPALAGLFAIVGHIFPIWLKFRGGKGVATGLGSFVLLAPKGILLAVGVFILIVAVFRYVSLGSIIAVGLFPIFAWLTNASIRQPAIMTFIATSSFLIIAKHHENIRRLVTGTENRWGRR